MQAAQPHATQATQAATPVGAAAPAAQTGAAAPKAPTNAAAPKAPQAVRHFARFQLLRLAGKSARTMLWRVEDPRVGQELLLALPRTRPADAQAADHWLQLARRATRIDHPSLAQVVEVGEHERWPYITYDPGLATLLSEQLSEKGAPAQEVVPWAVQVLQGLAFAHEAGALHLDIQPHMVLLPDIGPARLLGVGVALDDDSAGMQGLQAQRQAAERDILAMGLLLHHALAGTPALEQPDVSEVIARLPPLGRELVRLPFSTAHTIPDALRAIVNRATDRQERQRYRNARTVIRALEGWLVAEQSQGDGPLALLLDRIQAVGLLPAMPGASQRGSLLVNMERERNDALAALVLQDLGLSFELMRMVNVAQASSGLSSGNGPILTIRRTIDMLGLDGVRRATNALRPWPGPLNEANAAALAQLMERVRRAGQIAQWLRPAGYDAEVVYLLAALQNLGRLLVQYHLPDEAAQIERLMKPAAGKQSGDPEEPGMGEEAASLAVLGVDITTLAAAVGRRWGLDDSALHMIQRTSPGAPVRAGEADGDLLRMVASCANEVMDASRAAAHHQVSAMQRIVQRYGKALGISLRDLQLAAAGQAPDSVDASTSAAEAIATSPRKA